MLLFLEKRRLDGNLKKKYISKKVEKKNVSQDNQMKQKKVEGWVCDITRALILHDILGN